MNIRSWFMVVGLPIVAGCGTFATLAPEVACTGPAKDYGGPVVGAFSTTVGAIRRLQPRDPQPALWSDRVAEYPAILCYVDAQIGKGPPPGPNGEAEPRFDRIVLGIVDGVVTVVEAGYRDRVPVVAP